LLTTGIKSTTGQITSGEVTSTGKTVGSNQTDSDNSTNSTEGNTGTIIPETTGVMTTAITTEASTPQSQSSQTNTKDQNTTKIIGISVTVTNLLSGASAAATEEPNTTGNGESGSRISTGAIIAIAIGGAAGILICATFCIILFCVYFKKRKKTEKIEDDVFSMDVLGTKITKLDSSQTIGENISRRLSRAMSHFSESMILENQEEDEEKRISAILPSTSISDKHTRQRTSSSLKGKRNRASSEPDVFATSSDDDEEEEQIKSEEEEKTTEEDEAIETEDVSSGDTEPISSVVVPNVRLETPEKQPSKEHKLKDSTNSMDVGEKSEDNSGHKEFDKVPLTPKLPPKDRKSIESRVSSSELTDDDERVLLRDKEKSPNNTSKNRGSKIKFLGHQKRSSKVEEISEEVTSDNNE